MADSADKQSADASEIRLNEHTHRFELGIGDSFAYVHYRWLTPKIIAFTHTEVPEALNGKGVGSRLARHVLDWARASGLEVEPLCPFIAAYMKRHPEYEDLRRTTPLAFDAE